MRRQFGAVRHSPGNLSERGYQSAKGDEAAEYEKFITFFGQVHRFREKAIANCHKSAHGEEMSEQFDVRRRKNAGLSL